MRGANAAPSAAPTPPRREDHAEHAEVERKVARHVDHVARAGEAERDRDQDVHLRDCA
jgi:hypothetical protein